MFAKLPPLWMALLCGCAAGTQSRAATAVAEPDCSFRSPTTCWTVSARFPRLSSETPLPPADSLSRDPSALIASGTDTVTKAR